MKILIITSQIRTRSGYGRVSYDLINSLRAKGNDVLVICGKINDEFPGIKQIQLLPDPRNFRKAFFLSWFYALKSMKHKKETAECDLIHCVVEHYSFFTFLLAGFLKKRYFLHMHGTYSVFFFQYKILGFLQKIAYKNAQKIICVSNFTKNKILKHKKFGNLVVIPNGVNQENFSAGGKRNFLGKENILMSLGAFKKRKGFDLLIKSLAIAKKEIPDIKCFIGGGAGWSDEYYKKIVNLSEGLGLSENIVFFKNADDEYVKNLYKKAKIFVLTLETNEYDFDGFGLVYLEANASGIPVVGLRGTCAEDAIKDGYNGFLAKYNDADDVAQKIIILLKDGKLYDQMSENALLWAGKMSWENIINEYIKIYQQ